MKYKRLAVLVLALAPGAASAAPPPAAPAAKPSGAKPTSTAPADPATAMLEAAQRFLAALTPTQKERAHHPFGDQDRESFEYVPMTRNGLPLKLIEPAQRPLVAALLETGLSQAGHLKVKQLIELETVLAELERNPVRRDPENYHVFVFGDPRPKQSWGWKFEGHHVSLNFTVANGSAVVTVPTFLGANPAEVRSGPLTGRRVLRAEEDLARKLVQSFAAGDRAKVIFDAKAPPEILTTDQSTVKPLPEVGIAAAAMAPAQKELLRQLLAEYAATFPATLAAQRLQRIEAGGFDKLRFGWAGSTDRGQPHYYRIAGPTFVLEYDNTQNGANHIHTAWRDFEGDFGRDLLREHRKTAH